MQPTGIFRTPLVEDHPRIIPVMFGQNPVNGFREEDIMVTMLMQEAQHMMTDNTQRLVIIDYLMNTLCSGELKLQL